MVKRIEYYVCKICKTKWLSYELAKMCEEVVLPECPVKVGQTVKVYLRYDEPKEDTVEDILVKAHFSNEYLNDRTIDELEDQGVLGYFKGHQYFVKLKNSHQISKDKWTKKVTLASIFDANNELFSEG